MIIALLVATHASVAAADSTGVLPVEGTNLSQGEQDAIGALFANAYAGQAPGRVWGPNETGPTLQETGSVPDAVTQMRLTEYITLSAIKLATRVTLTAVRYNQDGSELFRVSETATSLDDMQVVSERVAEALYRRTAFEHTQTIDNVTGMQAKPRKRTFSEKVLGIRTGVMVPFGRHVDTTPAVLLQFNGRLEATTYFLEFGAGFMLPSDLGGNSNKLVALVGHLGASYYLTHTSISPYVGGGVSPRIIGGDYDGIGLTGNAHLGVMFMRHASTRIYLELQLDQNLLPLRQSSDYYDDDGFYRNDEGRKVWPTELSLAAGIGW